ncbi:hypothetical protein F2P79_006050 [Pimephales promelas]|nr:hypothetical protein F2P79_006050 [Pimephales promelas]
MTLERRQVYSDGKGSVTMSPHRASLPAPNHQGKRKQRQPCDTLFCPPGTCSQAKPPLRVPLDL